MKEWKEIPVNRLNENVFTSIGSDWMLITAGNMSSWNTMTAAWGGFGFLWKKNVVFIYVRPSRLTYEFMENNGTFSLSFFTESERDLLTFCGRNSGRDVNKAEATGLKPVDAGHGTVAFEQARLVVVCRKIYSQDLDPSWFLDPDIENNYKNGNYHRHYIGEIISIAG